uniref:RGS domain-containing protein n=1 Tax=Elaeophora elaphi TaxID=1147741 RepID=A0A0R3S1A8_9BILA
MRNSDWNNHNSHTYRHHRHCQTTSLSPSSSGHIPSLLPATRQCSKSGCTYGVNPCGAECSRNSEDASSNLHTLPKIKNQTSLLKSKIPISIRHNDLDYTTGSSSITSSTTVSENFHQKLIGVPFITTTSDITSDGSSVADVKPSIGASTNARYLCANETQKNSEDSINSVRRTASFTFSPKGCLDKVNQRLQVHDIEPKRRFSRFAKTLDFIKSKMDSCSTSTLYPSKEEIMQWQDSFERLLNHKYGCLLFRTFLKGEFSDENVDFWIECEEFRKMKEGKKSTIQKAHSIYNKYIAEQSPKEVNLDSDTRTATKAALENGAKLNMFSLAQTRIEQLMAKDSYRRFLKSKLFLDLLTNGTSTASNSNKARQKENEHERQSRLPEASKTVNSTYTAGNSKNF